MPVRSPRFGRDEDVPIGRSEVFDAVRHLPGFQDLPEQHQGAEELPDAARVLMAIGDPGMPDPLRVQQEVVVVMRDDQGHRIKIGGLGRMANSAFGGKLNFCGTSAHLFTMFMVALVVDNKYNVYVR